MKALSFTGSGGEYFKIWIVNVLLTIVTLGLYYPWAKVRNNRYFYANSVFEDRNFDYHATGKQLFLGYLVSIALLLLYIGLQSISPEASVVLILVFFMAFPWIIWQSLKFGMRMTSFSNVRFSFHGSLGQAYVIYLLLPLGLMLCIYGVPIGLAVMMVGQGDDASPVLGLLMFLAILLIVPLAIYLFAYMKNRSTRYTFGGLRYGQGTFATEVKTNEFFKIGLKAFGLMLLLSFVLFSLIGVLAAVGGSTDQLLAMTGDMENDPEALEELFSGPLLMGLMIVYLGFIAVAMIVFSYSYSRQRRYIFDNTELDQKVKFASTLGARAMAWITISNFLAIIFSLGLALPWARVRMVRFMMENSLADPVEGFDEYLTQQLDQQSSLGEQIGDAFDVDVGLGI